MVWHALGGLAWAVPLADVVLFGKVFAKAQGMAITGSLPCKILATSSGASAGRVIASTQGLFAAAGAKVDTYVLRIPRGALGTDVARVGPGDRLHLFLDEDGDGIPQAAEEVLETLSVGLLATADSRDVRYLSLNQPNKDGDGDGLPDAWEGAHFASLAPLAADDLNKDGVTNLMALAGGLNPQAENASRMPYLQIESNGSLALYFRQATAPTGTIFRIESTSQLSAGSWAPVTGISPVAVSNEGASTLWKAVVSAPSEITSRNFFRIAVHSVP